MELAQTADLEHTKILELKFACWMLIRDCCLLRFDNSYIRPKGSFIMLLFVDEIF